MGGQNTIRAVSRAFDVVRLLQDRETATLDEVASEFSCAKSTIHRYLTTLVSEGYVVREDVEYALSLQFLEHGECARTRNPHYALAAQTVETLAEETEERAQFIVEERGRGVYVHRETGRKAVDVDTYLGRRVPLHASAAGLAILSRLPTAEVEAILDRWGLEAVTDQTITERDALFEELDRTRDRGYSVNDQGFADGLRAVGVPISDGDDGVLGGISIAGPTNRFDDERLHEDLPSYLLGMTNELELRIAYS